ncbi:MAG TPA: S8 family serine peptidase, partial [Streptosporangiaceae bacterium]
DPLVISAGAVDNFRLVAMDDGYRRYVSENMAALSSGGTAPSGKTVDLVAPGWYGGEAACADGSGGCPASYPTESMRGTSEAAPLIAGAAADVIQAYRDTHHGASPTPAVVKEILTGTATDISAPVDQQGSGLLNVYAAVKAAQQMPGGTAGGGASALIASPSQLDVSGDGGTTSSQSVSLYNAGGSAVAVTGSYRRIGREFRIGKTVTENVSAPDPSQPVPEAGATAASPVTFQVPRHLGRLDVDMIWPDPANSSTLQIQLFNPSGALAQESYDDGSPATARRAGSIPNIQHIEVSAPQAGRWTARILWSGKDQDLALPPIAPGSYAGPMSFRVSGQDWVTRQATTRPVIIGAHASASVPLRVRFPAAPGDHPESVQFTGTAPHGHSAQQAAASVPVARRTLIPSSGGTFRTLLTSTVGRSIGQVNTYDMTVPAGLSQLTVSFQTADVGADNVIGYYLVDPAGNLVATGSTPDTAAGQVPGTVTLTAPDPVAGTWEIDVELGVTVSGHEFTQTVHGTVSETG